MDPIIRYICERHSTDPTAQAANQDYVCCGLWPINPMHHDMSISWACNNFIFSQVFLSGSINLVLSSLIVIQFL